MPILVCLLIFFLNQCYCFVLFSDFTHIYYPCYMQPMTCLHVFHFIFIHFFFVFFIPLKLFSQIFSIDGNCNLLLWLYHQFHHSHSFFIYLFLHCLIHSSYISLFFSFIFCWLHQLQSCIFFFPFFFYPFPTFHCRQHQLQIINH